MRITLHPSSSIKPIVMGSFRVIKITLHTKDHFIIEENIYKLVSHGKVYHDLQDED